MTWWGRDADPSAEAVLVRGSFGRQPQLVRADAGSTRAAVRDRVPSFTPEWTNLNAADAGVALVRLFGVQLEPVLRRTNRLPEKALVEYVAAAGVRALSATPAATFLKFTVAQSAERSVFVPEGMQAAAPPATGEGDLVTFETLEPLYATPAELVEVRVQEGALVNEVELPEPGDAFLPFGRRARPGRVLWLGLSGPAAAPGLSLGVLVAAPPGAPPPAAHGGIVPIPIAPAPLLRWEILDGGTPLPAEVLSDGTGGLVRSGVVSLGLPERWREGRPAILGEGEPRRWLRVRIVHGSFGNPPSFAGVFLNAARAEAVRTVRDEVLEPLVVGAAGARTVMRVTQTPVVPGSMIVEVDEGLATDVFGVTSPDADSGPAVRRWAEIQDLTSAGPDDRVFVVDSVSGEVTFGDGVNGARVPQGFRNVVAVRYRVGGGRAGAVAAEEVTTLLTSIAFVTGVSNPLPASGGTDVEPLDRVVRRGPREVRTRGRAVTTVDYELLAPRAPGADVARAHAVAGLHPALGGRPIPGVVGVFVVPPDRGEGPPTPDEGTLGAVARFLADEVAPAGVEVVAAAPRYHSVRVEAQVVVDRAADPGAVVRRVVEALDKYLHPLTGGDAGEGWPFGGALRYSPLVQRVLALDDVRAVPRLDFIVDGIRVRPCEDYTIAPHGLLWPETHEVVAQPEVER